MNVAVVLGGGVVAFLAIRAFANRRIASAIDQIPIPGKIDEKASRCQPDPTDPDFPFEVVLEPRPTEGLGLRALLRRVFGRDGTDREIVLLVGANPRIRFRYSYLDGRKVVGPYDGGDLDDAEVIYVPDATTLLVAPRAWAMYASRPRSGGPWSFDGTGGSRYSVCGGGT